MMHEEAPDPWRTVLMKKMLALSIILLTLSGSSAFAYLIEDQDEFSLELKGFSPELIEMTQVYVNRNEGRYPPPSPTRLKQAWYNLLNNEVVEPLQPPGYTIIEKGPFPKHPR
jgi:hypothetical protein